jgi:hypothetical protein
METKFDLNYESPWLSVLEIEPEGVICESGNTEHVNKNDGLW